MRRFLTSLGAVSLVAGFLAVPSASAQQSVNFFLGGFVPTSADARGDASGTRSNDILVRDRDYLTLDIERFRGVNFGGEYLVVLGKFFEAGAGLGFYQRTVPAADTAYVSTSGASVIADLKLRVVPFNATFRVLPLGHRSVIEPYVGGGIGVLAWRYSESGQFVDHSDRSIFNSTFVGSGTATGPVVLGGLRVPIGPMAPGFEIRWQSGKGDLPTSQDFPVNTKIDLGGISYAFTFQIRF